MKISLRYCLLLLLILVFVSCTPQKKLIYLQNIETGVHDSGRAFIYTLRPGDVLSINIYSADENVGRAFSSHKAQSSASVTDASTYLHGFVVSDSGYVHLPLVGKVYVEGLSIEKASEKIDSIVKEFFLDAMVDVKLVSFQVTILGEVNRPGTFRLYNPKVNILEAIALAGDLNVYGKRDLTLIRKTEMGHEIFKIDLKDKNLMSHECFYLLPNDIIYVEPHRAKVYGFNAVPIATLLSTVTTLILILRFIQ